MLAYGSGGAARDDHIAEAAAFQRRRFGAQQQMRKRPADFANTRRA
jgi:hypothetical protein